MTVLSQKVLLLNADIRPLGVIDMVRAVSMVFRGVARIEEKDDDHLLRTQHSTYPVPSVVSLVRYVDVRRKRRESGKQRFHIFVRDHFRCQYCSLKVGQTHPLLLDVETKRPRTMVVSDLTLDHVLPSSKGGSNDSGNIATCCHPCNQRKGARTPDEARMPLLTTPSALRYGLDWAMLQHFAENYPKWRPYVFLDAKVA